MYYRYDIGISTIQYSDHEQKPLLQFSTLNN